MKLTNTPGSTYTPAPEGIHSAICVDVIDLGIVETAYGEKPKLRLVFELEAKMPDGRPFIQTKSFTASLHPKANLNQFLSKWRGRPIAENEVIDFDKLLGAQVTLVISHVTAQDGSGKVFSNIDAVSKPTKKLVASGHYDPAAARQRIAEYAAKQPAHTPKPATGKPAAAKPAVDDSDQFTGEGEANPDSF